MTVRYREPSASFTPAGKLRPTTLMQHVSRYLQQQNGEPASLRTLTKGDALHGRAEYRQLAVEVLVAEGFVEESPGPNRARMFRHVRPYVEAMDPQANGSNGLQVSPESREPRDTKLGSH